MQTRVKVFLIGLGAALSTAGCLFLGADLPAVENHTPAAISAALLQFELSECPEANGVRTCAAGSVPAEMGCDRVRAPGEILAGLTPNRPLLVCLSGGPGRTLPDPEEYVYSEGCLVSYAVRYLTQEDGELRLIKTRANLQRAFAPIDSEAEALSFALAAGGLGVRYGLEADRSLRYFVDDLQDTFVLRSEGGFLVRLYDYRLCGCGPHPTYAVDLLVTPAGEIEEIQRTKVFEDPVEDDLCID